MMLAQDDKSILNSHRQRQKIGKFSEQPTWTAVNKLQSQYSLNGLHTIP